MKRKLIFSLLVLVFAAACGSQNESNSALNLDIQLRLEPENPSVGLSTLILSVHDENGQAVSDAQISIMGNMSHEGMARVEASSNTGENGIYNIPFEWTMGGDWFLDVTVNLANNGGSTDKRFVVFVNAASENSIIHQTPVGD